MKNNIYNHQLGSILIFLIISIVFAVFFAISGKVISILVRSNNPNKHKNQPFECGFPTLGRAREKLDVRFYLVAVLFLIFDLEITFIIPWGINLRASNIYPSISNEAFVIAIIFLVILFLGLIYSWKKGALEWE